MLVYRRKGKESKSLISPAKPIAQKPQLVHAKRRVRSNRVGGGSGRNSSSWFSRCLIADGFLNNLTSLEKSGGDGSKSTDLLLDLNQRPCDFGAAVESDLNAGIAELDEKQHCASKNLDSESPPTLISSTTVESAAADVAEARQPELNIESNESVEANIHMLSQCDELNTQHQESNVLSFGRKRKNDTEIVGSSQKRPKRKQYVPKVIGQGRRKKAPNADESMTKRPPKSKTPPKVNRYEKKSTRALKQKTPKLSTLKKNSRRKQGRQATSIDASSIKTCRRSLNFENNEESSGDQSLNNQIGPQVLKCESEQNKVVNREKDAKNSSGLQSNSLQVFQKFSRLGTCLIESRKVHPKFSRACKKKRIQKCKAFSKSGLIYSDSKVFNIKCLTKKKRSNRTRRISNIFTQASDVVNSKILERSEGEIVENSSEIMEGKSEIVEIPKGKSEIAEVSNEVIEFLIAKFLCMKIDRRRKGRKKHNASNNALVLYNRGDGKLALYQRPKRKLLVKVAIDKETLKVFKLLMEGKEHKETDEEKRKYWEKERNIFEGRANSFISRMHIILGNRQFSPWKGSVMDSIVGVFLTQNVSDHLSSNAFIKLAATFRIQKTTGHEISEGNFGTCFSQELVGIGTNFLCLTSEKIKDIMFNDSSRASTSSWPDIHKSMGGNSTSKNKPPSPGLVYGKKKTSNSKKNENVEEKRREEEEEKQYWTRLREIYSRPRHNDHTDSVDWEAVWKAPLDKVAEAIKDRGQHYIIADRILAFIKTLKETNGTIDVEWLREAPPDIVKEYLLKVYGLGLKSVECIRLLALQQIAFPVDVNVGRIVVRLGWVPLEPLPDHVLIHNLDKFPLTDMIQKYLWPRLCTLDQRTLYELHYQMITFGKVFCTKVKPNCKACPMKGECKYFASVLESLQAKLTMPTTNSKPTETQVMRAEVPTKCFPNLTMLNEPDEVNRFSNLEYEVRECEPIIEMPASPELEIKDIEDFGEEYENLEDFFFEDDLEEIPTINLSSKGHLDDQDDRKMSSPLLTLTVNPASIPTPKMKVPGRLRTERIVYVLPDSHPLLEGFETREPGDPSPYLLVIWSPGEIKNSCEESINTFVPGTILIPCRTAMRGSFPLNGTYFQVNEMFADDYSSYEPINVPRNWIWNLPQKITFFGTSTSSIFKGLSIGSIHDCFWNGYICVRAFDRMSRCPRPLRKTFHYNTTSQKVKKQGEKQKKEMEG